MVNDVISDCLTRIRNASAIGKDKVLIPKAGSCQKICNILKREGYILDLSTAPDNEREYVVFLKYKGIDKKPCITNLRRISTPSLRVFTKRKDMPQILNGMGILIVSTSKGILTDKEARFYGVGGEILCGIW